MEDKLEDGMEEVDDRVEAEITWDDDLSTLEANADWGPTACTHCSTIELLQQAISKSSTKCKQFGSVGRGPHPARKFGANHPGTRSTAAVMNLALATGKATTADMIKIRNELDTFR